jgi:hypothetical protein
MAQDSKQKTMEAEVSFRRETTTVEASNHIKEVEASLSGSATGEATKQKTMEVEARFDRVTTKDIKQQTIEAGASCNRDTTIAEDGAKRTHGDGGQLQQGLHHGRGQQAVEHGG